MICICSRFDARTRLARWEARAKPIIRRMLLRGRMVNNAEMGATVKLVIMLDHFMLLEPDVVMKSHHLKDCAARLTSCQLLVVVAVSDRAPPHEHAESEESDIALSAKCPSGATLAA